MVPHLNRASLSMYNSCTLYVANIIFFTYHTAKICMQDYIAAICCFYQYVVEKTGGLTQTREKVNLVLVIASNALTVDLSQLICNKETL